jgi:membrane-bound lytic murein transglycosylase D
MFIKIQSWIVGLNDRLNIYPHWAIYHAERPGGVNEKLRCVHDENFTRKRLQMKHRWFFALLGVWFLVSYGCSTAGTGRPAPAGTSPAASLPAAPPSTGQAPSQGPHKEPPPSAPAIAAKHKPDASAAKPSKPVSPPGDENGEECLIDDDELENQVPSPKGNEPALNRALALCRLAQTYWKRGELENAIDTLDRAYALVLVVEPGNDPKLMQEKEDLRFTISKRILEIYSSRHVVVNGKRNEIPVTINAHVQAEIDSFTIGRERDFFAESYRRSGRYRAMIEAALKEAGLPAELVWLALIESGFKVTALSPARALGLWQFIPSTGYRYNLNRDKYIDERMDPEKSTRAAIEYLKELHGMFGDWTTVLAAYNCGEHRVLRTIQAQNINYLDNFWDLYERLPRETARYVPRFLATLHIVQNLEKYGLSEVRVEAPLAYETATIPKQASLKSIALTTGVEEDQLRELNAELRQAVLPEAGYELRTPVGEAAVVLAKLDEIPIYRMRPGTAVVRHKVRKGETLQTIAKKYVTDTKSIMLANNMRRPAAVSAGTTLRVPLECPPERPAVAAGARPSPSKGDSVDHVVRQGDSLFNIAKRYGTTTEDIQRLNQLTGTHLTVGQVLKIAPAAAQIKPASPQPSQDVYIVRSGDTLYSIAKQHNTTVERLLALNQLGSPAKLQPGQRILVD